MPLRINPETEKIVREALAAGRFESLDEIIAYGIRAKAPHADEEGWEKHREAIRRTEPFVKDSPLRLQGISFAELMEEARRM